MTLTLKFTNNAEYKRNNFKMNLGMSVVNKVSFLKMCMKKIRSWTRIIFRN